MPSGLCFSTRLPTCTVFWTIASVWKTSSGRVWNAPWFFFVDWWCKKKARAVLSKQNRHFRFADPPVGFRLVIRECETSNDAPLMHDGKWDDLALTLHHRERRNRMNSTYAEASDVEALFRSEEHFGNCIKGKIVLQREALDAHFVSSRHASMRRMHYVSSLCTRHRAKQKGNLAHLLGTQHFLFGTTSASSAPARRGRPFSFLGTPRFGRRRTTWQGRKGGIRCSSWARRSLRRSSRRWNGRGRKPSGSFGDQVLYTNNGTTRIAQQIGVQVAMDSFER